MIEDDNENKKPLISNNYNEDNNLIDKDNLSDIDENEINNNKKISNENLNEIKNISDLEEPILSSKNQIDSESSEKIRLIQKYEKEYENIDFYSNANFFSKIFYYWAFKKILLAKKVKLTSKHLGKMKGNNSSLEFMNYTYYVYNNLNYKNKRTCSLLKTILRSNIKHCIYVFIIGLICTGLNVFSINLFRQYIMLFSNEESNKKKYYLIGFGFLGVKFIYIFFNKQMNEYQNFVGFKTSVEMNCLIFDKVLTTSPASMEDNAESGEILNFVQVDSQKLTFMMMQSPNTITIPIMLIAYSIMLFSYLGWSFSFGLGVLLIFVLINFFLQRKFKKYQKIRQKEIDKRLKVTTETLFNLKVLKLYSWEDFFLEKIDEKRENELRATSNTFNITNLNRTLLWFSPIATAVVSIGAYQYYTDKPDVANIFTCLGILSSIQEPIRQLAMVYTNILDSLISLKRVEKFLSQADIKEENIILNDKNTMNENIDILIENGNFSWGAGKKSELKGDEKNKKLEEKEIKLDKDSVSEENIISNENIIENEISTSKDKLIKDSNNKINNVNSNKSEIVEDIIITSSGKEIPIINNIPINLKDINLKIKKGEFICIIGDVGSGKSTLLQAILNNLIQVEKEKFNTKLIVNGTIAYTSQIAWIQNNTVRNNILFYKKYDEEKYNNIIKISELKSDLEILKGGDQTEIGEKGINLSGGQKARISIARALYSDCDIYMLDDPISALDANVGKNIINNCLCDYLKNKTRLLVTHALQYCSCADRIIYMKNGKINWIGPYNELREQGFFRVLTLKKKSSSISDIDGKNVNNENNEEEEEEEEEIEKPAKKNEDIKRITRDEDRVEGRLKENAYKLYLKGIGGIPITIILILLTLIWQGLKAASDLWLAFWTTKNDQGFNKKYFLIYAGLGLGSTIFTYIRLIITTNGSIKNSRNLHRNMVNHLIRAPINLYHDTVPKGQILNRLSKDLFKIDQLAQMSFSNAMTYSMNFVGEIILCSYFLYYSAIFVPFLLAIGVYIMQFYLNCSRELSRLEGVVRSPMINTLNEVTAGADTIRGYRLQKEFKDLFRSRADEFLKLRIYLNGTSQWFSLILDFLTLSFIAFLVCFTMFQKDKLNTLFESVQVVAILLNYCLQLQDDLVRYLLMRSNFENDMVGQERCLSYTTIKSEAPNVLLTDQNLVNWPSKGIIEFQNYYVRYRPDTEIVLKDLNFTIEASEKIGVVGRTGSGKSTIALCLFRILEPLKGRILIDNVDISEIGLSKLRSSITIIPQDPTLMEGSLRFNIDPLHKHSDNEIEEVMKKIGFWYMVENYLAENKDKNVNGLDMIIKEDGGNISIGEKQLICITRAILRKSKIIVMDEATASIDVKTERLIQNAINELLFNSTTFTIAHRIKTILNSDRILVLEKGEIAEFDSPQNLIENKNSLFYQLYKKSKV